MKKELNMVVFEPTEEQKKRIKNVLVGVCDLLKKNKLTRDEIVCFTDIFTKSVQKSTGLVRVEHLKND